MMDRLMRSTSRIWIAAIGILQILLLASCEKNPRAQSTTFEDSMAKYKIDSMASDLVRQHKDELLDHSKSQRTLDSPVTYLMVFRSNNSDVLTKVFQAGDDQGYERNLAITKRWQAIFCSNKLMSIMEENSISVVNGAIEDLSGKRHSLAICSSVSKSSSQNQTPTRNPLAENYAEQYDMALEYSADTVEVCALARLTAGAYRQSLDEDNYKYWKALEEISCLPLR